MTATERTEWGEPLADGNYPFWNPHHQSEVRRGKQTVKEYDGEPGDVLEGKIAACREGINKFKKKQFFFDFESARATYHKKPLEGTVFTLVLSQAHERQAKKLVEGNLYRIVYVGPKDVGQPNPMAEFKIYPAKGNAPF